MQNVNVNDHQSYRLLLGHKYLLIQLSQQNVSNM